MKSCTVKGLKLQRKIKETAFLSLHFFSSSFALELMRLDNTRRIHGYRKG